MYLTFFVTIDILQTPLAGKGKDDDSRILQKPAYNRTTYGCLDVRGWCYFPVYV